MATTSKSFYFILVSILFMTGCTDYRELGVSIKNEKRTTPHIALKQNNHELKYLEIIKGFRYASNGACIIDVNAPLTISIDTKRIKFRLDKVSGWHFSSIRITIYDEYIICEQIFHDKELDSPEKWGEWMNTVERKTITQRINY